MGIPNLPRLRQPSLNSADSEGGSRLTAGPQTFASSTPSALYDLPLPCSGKTHEFVSEPRVRMTGCPQVLGICLCRELQRALTARPGER